MWIANGEKKKTTMMKTTNRKEKNITTMKINN